MVVVVSGSVVGVVVSGTVRLVVVLGWMLVLVGIVVCGVTVVETGSVV